ncbi:MarR family winged helix-turn-helix transcriptional regulator [Actinomadura atramentaria]|uniref:MarR family winged helix-turn-helix transcriptional regulator n=1 Tax=Actinomadura atramentaria TaxID=1990 RepID=UPI0005269A5A|nr:MarR family transcriptional regulator [Actinomadura atramentaria]
MHSGEPVDDLDLAAGLTRVVTTMRMLGLPRDVSMTSLSTLASLERVGPARLTDLAAREGVTQPAMTQLVSRLERAGLAERFGDPDDRRVVLVRITDAGRADLARRRAGQAERLAALLAELPPGDRAAIERALPALDRLGERVIGAVAGYGQRIHPQPTAGSDT